MLALLLLGELFLRENKTDVRCGIKIRALLELRPKAPYKCIISSSSSSNMRQASINVKLQYTDCDGRPAAATARCLSSPVTCIFTR